MSGADELLADPLDGLRQVAERLSGGAQPETLPSIAIGAAVRVTAGYSMFAGWHGVVTGHLRTSDGYILYEVEIGRGVEERFRTYFARGEMEWVQ